jgi:hypothetical protein
VTGSKIQVVGGALTANVVDRRPVIDETQADPRYIAAQAEINRISDDGRVKDAQKAIEEAPANQKDELKKAYEQIRAQVAGELKLNEKNLIEIQRKVYEEAVARRAEAFNNVHTTERALRVGSVRAVVAPDQLYSQVQTEMDTATRAFYLHAVQVMENPDEDPRVIAANARLTWSTDDTLETDRARAAQIRREVEEELQTTNQDPRVMEARRAIEQGSVTSLQDLTRAYMRIRDHVAVEVARTLARQRAAIEFIQNPRLAMQALSQGLNFLLSQEAANPEARKEILGNISQLRGILEIVEQVAHRDVGDPPAGKGEGKK